MISIYTPSSRKNPDNMCNNNTNIVNLINNLKAETSKNSQILLFIRHY